MCPSGAVGHMRESGYESAVVATPDSDGKVIWLSYLWVDHSRSGDELTTEELNRVLISFLKSLFRLSKHSNPDIASRAFRKLEEWQEIAHRNVQQLRAGLRYH